VFPSACYVIPSEVGEPPKCGNVTQVGEVFGFAQDASALCVLKAERIQDTSRLPPYQFLIHWFWSVVGFASSTLHKSKVGLKPPAEAALGLTSGFLEVE
jgi:hypothetical protein